MAYEGGGYGSYNSYGYSDDREKEEEEKRKRRRVYSTDIIDSLIREQKSGYEIPYDAFFNRDTELRAPNVSFSMTEEELAIYQKCFDDPLWFVENYAKFLTDNGRSLVQLRDYQKNIIRTVTEEKWDGKIKDLVPSNRNIIVMAARQIGKTTTVAAFMAWMMIFHMDRNILVVANKEKTSMEIVDKILNIFRGLPYFMKPGCVSYGKTGLKLDNGSQLYSSATTNTTSIGFTIHCLLLDEFAHIPANIVNSFWRSVYPTLSSSKVSQCIITSTPNGTTNMFYDIWTRSLAGENSFKNIRVDYWEVPEHDAKWADQMRRDLGAEEFSQEFELQFNINSRMLMSASDLDFLSRTRKDFVRKDLLTGNAMLDSDPNLVWDPDFDPTAAADAGDRIVMIVDIAEGTEDSETVRGRKRTKDSNTIGIYRLRLNSLSNMRRYANVSCKTADAFRFVQVGRFDCNTQDEVYTGKICAALCYDLFHSQSKENVKVMVEMNFNGKSFVTAFQLHPDYSDSELVRTYHTKPIPGETQRRRLGFKMTTTKEYYCKKGERLVAMRRIIPRDRKTLEQMQAFGYVKGKLGGIACHDDLSLPVFNHISRMLDEDTFVEWLDECLDKCADEKVKWGINSLMEKWDMENPELSDGAFGALYGVPSDGGQMAGLGEIGMIPQRNPYSSM